MYAGSARSLSAPWPSGQGARPEIWWALPSSVRIRLVSICLFQSHFFTTTCEACTWYRTCPEITASLAKWIPRSPPKGKIAGSNPAGGVLSYFIYCDESHTHNIQTRRDFPVGELAWMPERSKGVDPSSTSHYDCVGSNPTSGNHNCFI